MKKIFTLLFMAFTLVGAVIATPQPDFNPTCQDLGYDNGYKIDENPSDGSYDNGYLYVTISNSVINDDDETWMFDWSTNHPVNGVIVKAGRGYLLYPYDPAQSFDVNVTAPENKGVSHVTFCWDDGSDVPEFGVIGAALALFGIGVFVYKKRH